MIGVSATVVVGTGVFWVVRRRHEDDHGTTSRNSNSDSDSDSDSNSNGDRGGDHDRDHGHV